MLEFILKQTNKQTNALLLYLRVRWTELGQGQKKVMKKLHYAEMLQWEQREFTSVSPSPENKGMKLYRQHISMADPGWCYMWKKEKNMKSSYILMATH